MQDLLVQLLSGGPGRTCSGNFSTGVAGRTPLNRSKSSMLSRHKKALSDMKSAEKKLRDAQNKYNKTRTELAKARKGVVEAKARVAAAQELWES